MKDNYPKAYKEIIEILKFLPQESTNKIPKKIIETFKQNMDNDYVFTIDINKNFEEQNLLDETKAILANIFRDYWATPYQKEKIVAKEKYDRQKIEERKESKYNTDIFNQIKSENDTINEQQEQENNNLPIEAKKDRFYKKIIKFFKKFFHIEGK